MTRAGGYGIFLVTLSPWFDARSWVMTLENGEPNYLTGWLAEHETDEKDWTKSEARRAKMKQNRMILGLVNPRKMRWISRRPPKRAGALPRESEMERFGLLYVIENTCEG